MSLYRDIFGLTYFPLKWKRVFMHKFFGSSLPRLRVLSFHDMSFSDEDFFERQLRWVMRSWKFISPLEFSSIVNGVSSLKQDSVLLTFDDGTISNLGVAERILNPLGIKALFFVVTKYALLSQDDDWRKFAANQIMQNENHHELPDNFRNMSINDLKTLINSGHTVGAHTASHFRLSELSESEIEAEIVSGADLLEKHLGVTVNHFAYPFGNFASISRDASRIAKKRFKCVYTGMRGNNAIDSTPWHLSRESNDPRDSLFFTGACLEGAADFLYFTNHKVCKSWHL
jgi:peptidoglycan/xylan/chitin deacetylase (PgdA/CDA1 family)